MAQDNVHVAYASRLENGYFVAQLNSAGAGCRMSSHLHETRSGARGMRAGDQPSDRAAFYPGSQLRGARVLVVDDSDVIRDVTRSVLEDAGVVVEEAADGAVAVQWMHDNPARCQLILMDVQMPVLDGIAATRAIRAELGSRTPPIIAVTAQASDAEKRACRDAGMRDHLAKPLDPVQLIDTVCRWLVPAAPARHVARGTVDAPVADDRVLPEVPGFDLHAGLRCVGGKTALLRSLLLRFSVNHADVVAHLRALVAAAAFREARRVAHTLKGAAATLGGTAIAQRAAQAEALLLQMAEAADSAPTGVFAQLETALAALQAALQQSLPALRDMATPQQAAPVPPATASTDMPQSEVAEYQVLRQLLADNCYAARKAFAALQERLGADDADWRAAAAAMNALDFGQALARLDARYPAGARAS